jgi:hypothetical protein
LRLHRAVQDEEISSAVSSPALRPKAISKSRKEALNDPAPVIAESTSGEHHYQRLLGVYLVRRSEGTVASTYS